MKTKLIAFTVFLLSFYGAKCQNTSNAAFLCAKVQGVDFCSDLGKLMQSFYKVGKYEEMMKYTSKQTLSKYGRNKVLDYYKNCQLGYKMKIISFHNESEYVVLNYEATINATSRVLYLKTIVENDTAKVVLDGLKIMQGL